MLLQGRRVHAFPRTPGSHTPPPATRRAPTAGTGRLGVAESLSVSVDADTSVLSRPPDRESRRQEQVPRFPRQASCV